MEKWIVRTLDLPLSLRSLAVRDDDGNINVYVNTRYSKNEQKRQLLLQLQNIKNGETLSADIMRALAGRTK